MNEMPVPAASAPVAGVLESLHPLQALAFASAGITLLLACMLWFASYHTDRLALRLFALRYLLASLAWFFVHPQALQDVRSFPLGSMVAAVGVLLLNLVAQDVYLGLFSRRRTAWSVLAALSALAVVAAYHRVRPHDAMAIYLVMGLAMGWLAWLTWHAAESERNMGHRIVAVAYLSYPVALLVALVLAPRRTSGLELGYLAVWPSIAVGLAVLVASLVRFTARLEAALAQREAAEREVREMNSRLESRVADRTEELRNIVTGLESYVRIVSHDLRGPLSDMASVVRLAQSALDYGDVARARELLAPVGVQADRLTALVHDLLLLSRLDDASCQREEQALAPLMDAAMRQLEQTPDTAALTGLVEVQVQPLPRANVDGSLMQQVFVNLLSNALRFAAAGAAVKPTVRVSAEVTANGPVVAIEDNGPGFPMDAAGELFKAFSRLHGGGLSQNGIGLSIVRRIVEHHRGQVWAERAAGGGARFCIRFSP